MKKRVIIAGGVTLGAVAAGAAVSALAHRRAKKLEELGDPNPLALSSGAKTTTELDDLERLTRAARCPGEIVSS
ncbi:MAG: hypothetical protein RL681_23 [Candidatus Parcubacteria bacterium]|jgi:hypothetical protein